MMNRMKAFEIRINDATPMIVAADNHVIADFTYGVSAINPNSAVIAGFDDGISDSFLKAPDQRFLSKQRIESERCQRAQKVVAEIHGVVGHPP